MIKAQLKKLAQQYLEEIISIRRHLHAYPELSFEEYKTSEFIKEKLREFGISYKDGFVKTGIVAEIKGTKYPATKDGLLSCIALRADIDALPITEKNNIEYKSKNIGVMHACGHDVHTASLLGVAKIIRQLRSEFSGTVKFIFQPGEEKLPGGASLMIKEGVLENPKPSAIYAQHVFPTLEAGKVGFRAGKYMASTDEIYLTVVGKGGHAAMKGTYINPLPIASEIILALEKTFSGEMKIPTVFALGKIEALGATNVIPEVAKLEGTFRTIDETWRKEAHEIIRRVATATAKNREGSCEVNIMNGYPALINHEVTTTRAKVLAEEYLGKENVVELDMRMTGEDFSFYAQQLPACFYRLGTANVAKGVTSGVHTPTFNIDEKALEVGMGLMAWIALKEIEK